jgi:alkylresorcinol/alkylpyrone synthase
MSFILYAKTHFPPNKYSQNQIADIVGTAFHDHKDAVEKIFSHAHVKERSLALELNDYKTLSGLEERNSAWQKQALRLTEENLKYFFEEKMFPIEDVGAIFSTTITGLMIPSLEARMMNRFPFSTLTKRIPIFGLGCLGGVALLARAHDYLKAYPHKAALVLATEFCSLTFQLNDPSMANIVGCSLFADGAAAVLLVGEKHPWHTKAPLQILENESHFFPQTERIMGWDIVDQGFKLVLSGDVPKVVHEQLAPQLKNFLDRQRLHQEDIGFMVAHPGGPKVLKAMQESLHLAEDSLSLSWQSLRDQGNMSSVSVLHVLEKTLHHPSLSHSNGRKNNSGYGLMVAMGPAFCAEVCLLKRVG